MSTYVAEELKEKISVTENGRRKRITKAQAIAKRLVNGAIAGETKMVPLLLGQTQAKDEANGGEAATDLPLAAEDDLVIRNVVARIRAAEPLPDTLSAMAPTSAASSGGGAEARLQAHAPDAPTE